jgi:hypothetical protein
MKKAIGIFFLAALLLSSTEAHQLLRLPFIFSHYLEHRDQNPRISFLEFLDLHYMHGSPHDDDYDKDMQLPFKTFGDCMAVMSPAFVPVFIQSVPTPPECLRPQQFAAISQTLHSSYLAEIWQPPRRA